MAAVDRMTQKNPDGVTFRVPLQKAGEFRVMSDRYNQALFGDVVNRLGQYEDCCWNGNLLYDPIKKRAKLPRSVGKKSRTAAVCGHVETGLLENKRRRWDDGD